MKNFYIIIGIVALVGAGVVAYAIRGGGNTASEPVDLGDIGDQELVAMAQGMVYGDANAPVTIMEFGDYQCPGCANFALTVKPQVDLAYIESGQAKLVFHDFPLPGHPHSFVAARAARCAGEQDRYFDYHDMIFRTQRQWSPMGSAVGHFNDLADELGLDSGAFRECLESDRHADIVTANLVLGQKLGVNSTPSVFVHRGGPPFRRLTGFQFIDVQQAMEAGSEN